MLDPGLLTLFLDFTHVHQRFFKVKLVLQSLREGEREEKRERRRKREEHKREGDRERTRRRGRDFIFVS